jgi:hypothetical protein
MEPEETTTPEASTVTFHPFRAFLKTFREEHADSHRAQKLSSAAVVKLAGEAYRARQTPPTETS